MRLVEKWVVFSKLGSMFDECDKPGQLDRIDLEFSETLAATTCDTNTGFGVIGEENMTTGQSDTGQPAMRTGFE